MYVGDYGYAASSSAWATALFYYNYNLITSGNWMYTDLNEWTITSCSNYSNVVFYVYYTGDVNYDSISSDFAIRPVFLS